LALNYFEEKPMKRFWSALGRLVFAISAAISVTSGALAADPGLPIPFASTTPQISDQGRGFMLIYNIYTSSPASAATQNARFTMTNTNDVEGTSVHLFFVEGSTCSISDRYVCLSQNQTISFLASEQDPGTTGYLVAVATYGDGFPRPFDYLIGDVYVKFSTGHFGNLGAEAFVSTNALYAGTTPDFTLFGLAMTNVPRVLAVDNIGSRADWNDTLLVINGVGGLFTNSAFSIGSLFGILYDDAEQPHSWNSAGGCQLVVPLSDSFPKTAPRFDRVIPAGQTGWMKFWSVSTINNVPFGSSSDPRTLLGAVFQRNSQVGSASGAFQEARNLHKLTVNSVVSRFQGGPGIEAETSRFTNAISAPQDAVPVTVFVFPIFPANCGFPGF
jgi:hypothetical protein